jgi:hypothetical protein
MKKHLNVFILFLISAVCLVQCSKNGTSIIEPKFGIYNFSTYTVDSFRFRIVLNGVTLTDSLLSPSGFFSKTVSFFTTEGRLQIIDAKNNNQLVLDSAIKMQTGTSNFSLVQLQKGQKPYIPAPPNEPLPAPGKYKVRFLYTSFIGDANFLPQPFFYDSVKCYIRLNGVNIDTVVLQKYGVTSFYEAQTGGGGTFTIRLTNPMNGSQIDASTSPSIGGTYTGFNTVSVSGRAMLNDWVIIRVY